MKNLLNIVIIFFIIAYVNADDDFISSLKDTKIKSQLRYYSMEVDITEIKENPPEIFIQREKTTKASNAIGGYVGFETGSYYGLRVGMTGYTSQPIFNNPEDEGGVSLLKDNQDGYSVLGEAFVKFQYNNTFIKAGRQLLSEYGYLSDKDIRMTPYTYEAIVVENRDFKDITLRVGSVFSVKPINSIKFINFIDASGETLKYQDTNRQTIVGSYNPNNFNSQGDYIGPNQNLYLASLVFDNTKLHVEVWDYYCENFINSFYSTLSYSDNIGEFTNTIGIQGVKQDNIGDHVAGQIDTYALGLKLQSRYKNFSLKYALNKMRYNENSYNGGELIINWGNNPLYNSLYYNDSQEAGAFSNSLSTTYNFSKIDTTMLFTAAKFNFPNKFVDNYGRQDNNEYDFVVNYKPHYYKQLSLEAIVIYVDFDTNYNFADFQKINGYKIAHIYDDIKELRFIMNYTF